MAGWFWQYGIWLTGLGGCLLIALVLSAWGLLGDRCKGRLRCPRCWYDMRGREGESKFTCPECGKTARSERQLQRHHRRYWAIVLGALLMLPPGYAGWVYHGWAREDAAATEINRAYHDLTSQPGRIRSMYIQTQAVSMAYQGPEWQWWKDRLPDHILDFYYRADTLSLSIDLGDANKRLADLHNLREVYLSDAESSIFRGLGPSTRGSETYWASDALQSLKIDRVEVIDLRLSQINQNDIHQIAEAKRLNRVELWVPQFRYIERDGDMQVEEIDDALGYDGSAFTGWAELNELKTVGLRNTCVDDEVLEHLAGIPNLGTLELSRANITRQGFVTIGQMDGLSYLRIDRTEMRDEDLVHVGGLTGLEYLYLNQAPITDAGLAHLATLTNLKMLWLNDIPTTEEGLQHLAGMTKMQRLAIPNAQIDGHALRHLAGMTRLKEIKLSDSPVDDTAGPHFRNWPMMQTLHLEKAENLTDAMVPHLLALPHLKQIYVQSAGISEGGKQKLRAAFPSATIP
ncbi:MAG: C2H2-type zinc finger protein [Planctomycetota bacterium]